MKHEIGRFKSIPVSSPGAYFLRINVAMKCGKMEFNPIIPINPR
jgi:hypothetical protein